MDRRSPNDVIGKGFRWLERRRAKNELEEVRSDGD
jgi:hypothetical protein